MIQHINTKESEFTQSKYDISPRLPFSQTITGPSLAVLLVLVCPTGIVQRVFLGRGIKSDFFGFVMLYSYCS